MVLKVHKDFVRNKTKVGILKFAMSTFLFCVSFYLYQKEAYFEKKILKEKRKNILDGIVISGGEPLLQKDIKRIYEYSNFRK